MCFPSTGHTNDEVSILQTPGIRAIHLTSWSAGSKKFRQKLEPYWGKTQVNAVVIAIKEYEGEVYIPGAPSALKAKAYVPAMPDIADWLKDLKQKNIYTIARIVVFKDNIYARKNPSVAVKNPEGGVWHDRKNIAWVDAYNKAGWQYNIEIASAAARLGFDEIQFDYIRFPTDGNLKSMRFTQPYQRDTAAKALSGFLLAAKQALHPMGVKISIDVFGLTTSDDTGMGIGQRINVMSEHVDYVCPMIYPSHYAKGEYGIPVPNDEPYKVVWYALRDARKMMGDQSHKLRPYLQDFSLKGAGIRYRAPEVRAQLQAAADHGILDWSLWNARSSYTWEALKDPVVPRVSPLLPKSKSSVSRSTFSVENSTSSK